MVLADINKWIKGGNEPSSDRGETPRSATANSNPGIEGAAARPSRRVSEHIAIVAVIGAFSSVALICLVLAMRQPVQPAIVADGTSQPSATPRPIVPPPPPESTSQLSEGGAVSASETAAKDAGRPIPVAPPPASQTISTSATPMPDLPPTTLSEAQLAAFLRDVGIWHDRHFEAAAAPERKPRPPQRVSRQHWPRHAAARPQTDHGEAARLMAEELRQRGIAPVFSERGLRRDRRPWQATLRPWQATQRRETLD